MVDSVLLLVDAAEGPLPADALRPPEGDGAPAAGRRGAQQDRPLRRPRRPRSSTTSTSCSWTSARTSTRSSSRSCTRTRRPGTATPRPRRARAPTSGRCSTCSSRSRRRRRTRPGHPLQLLVTNLSANEYVGPDGGRPDPQRHDPARPADHRGPRGGRRHRGRASSPAGRSRSPATVTSLQTAHGMERVDIAEAGPGEIVSVAGPARRHDRRHAHRARRPAAAAAPRRRRADPADDVRRQHLAARRPRRQVRHVAPDQGPPRSRGPRATSRSRSTRPSPATRSRSAAAASSSWPSSSSRCAARATS